MIARLLRKLRRRPRTNSEVVERDRLAREARDERTRAELEIGKRLGGNRGL